MRLDQQLADWLIKRKARRELCKYLKVKTTIPDLVLSYMGYYTWLLEGDQVAGKLWSIWQGKPL